MKPSRILMIGALACLAFPAIADSVKNKVDYIVFLSAAETLKMYNSARKSNHLKNGVIGLIRAPEALG